VSSIPRNAFTSAGAVGEIGQPSPGRPDSVVLHEISSAISAGEPISRAQAVWLWNEAPLHELARLAMQMRYKVIPERTVTFLIDRNVNYTNVCNSDCSFCGFYRHSPEHPEAYVLSKEVIGAKLSELVALGGTRVLLQGGHNDALPFDFYVDLISWIHKSFPSIEINSFSPSEIQQMRKVSGLSYEQILTTLKDAGMRSLPGGGAEILDDEIRRRVSPKKIKAGEWIEVMEVAHSLQLSTTSTMVIGFGETLEHRLNHLDRIRDAQSRALASGSAGFCAHISWPLQHSEATSMGRSRFASMLGATALEYLRHAALCRIYLHNVPHAQASWPTLGIEVGEIALHFGCDDIGSTMMEENVVSKAGALTAHTWSMSPEQLKASIIEAGFAPAQRDSAFNIIRRFDS
jgi:cyclic dehypoxanthinyl futalosine synthase